MADFEKYLQKIGVSDVDENLKISLETKYFQEVDFIDLIVLLIDNSNEAIDDDGAEQYMLIYDIRNNHILPCSARNGEFDISDADQIMHTYTDSWSCSIPDYYHEMKSFEGCWMACSIDNSWEISFHGMMDDTYGDISEKHAALIEKAIPLSTLYTFIKDVFTEIGKKQTT